MNNDCAQFFFSIVIPARDEEKYIESVFNSIDAAKKKLKEYYPDISTEVVVANNKSIDTTGEIAGKFADKVIYTEADSIAGVRNAGASAASGRVLITIDADSRMHPDTLIKIYSLINSTDIKAGCVWIKAYEHTPLIYTFIFFTVNFIFRLLNSGGGLYFCYLSDFQEIGGFNEKIFAAEDLDFAGRIKKHLAGKKQKFRNISGIPLRTSARKIKFVKFSFLIKKTIKFLFVYKKMLYNKKEWDDFWYNTNKLR